jgi:hypothetical protein
VARKGKKSNKISMNPSGIKPATFRTVAQYLKKTAAPRAVSGDKVTNMSRN